MFECPITYVMVCCHSFLYSLTPKFFTLLLKLSNFHGMKITRVIKELIKINLTSSLTKHMTFITLIGHCINHTFVGNNTLQHLTIRRPSIFSPDRWTEDSSFLASNQRKCLPSPQLEETSNNEELGKARKWQIHSLLKWKRMKITL